MEKEELRDFVQEWVKIDNEIRHLQQEQKTRKVEKKRLNVRLLEIMRSNKIDEIELIDGEIVYSKKNVKKPITQKNLLSILSSYFQGDLQKVDEINNYIIDKIETVPKEKIIRTVRKKVEPVET